MLNVALHRPHHTPFSSPFSDDETNTPQVHASVIINAILRYSIYTYAHAVLKAAIEPMLTVCCVAGGLAK